MNEDFNKGTGNGAPKKDFLANSDMIKGLLAVILGIICIVLAYKIILGILVFSCGLIVLYYGMGLLKLTSITNYINDIGRKIKNILQF